MRRRFASERTVVIGLDGMPYRLIKAPSENGRMPSTQALIEGGVLRQMASSIPGISCAAWSSIITGKNPAEHGVFGFADLAPRTYRMTFPNCDSLRREMLSAYRAVGHECFEAPLVADVIAFYEQAIECNPDDGKGYWDPAAAHGAGFS